MDDLKSLELLKEIIDSAKNATARHPYGFSSVFSGLIYDLMHITDHIQNDKLRMCFLHFMSAQKTFSSRLNYAFQNQVKEKLETLINDEKNIPESLKEIMSYGVNKLRIGVCSDGEGRDVIDMDELRSLTNDLLKDLDSSERNFILSKMSRAIRDILPEFVEREKDELIKFYNKLISPSEKDWSAVYNTIDEFALKHDKEGVLWQRGKG